jgi:glycosyltransferase involved in cell wall biosynthesis
LVYRARRHGGLGIVTVFRWSLTIKGLVAGGRRRRRRASPWPADQPLVSVLEGEGASLGVQTLTDLQPVSGPLAAAVGQARGKYLAVVPANCVCDPNLLEKAVLILEASPALGFVCGFGDGSATLLDTEQVLARCMADPERVFVMVRRPALENVAVPPDVDVLTLLRLLHAAAWEGTVLREAAGTLPSVPVVGGEAPSAPGRRGVLRLLPAALGVGLRQAWWDHVRDRRAGVSEYLTDFGRGLRTTKPDRETVLWLLPWLYAGGAEAVLLNMMAGLADRYHFLLCLTIDIEHGWRHRFQEIGCEIYALPELLPRRAWSPFLERLVTAKAVRTLVIAHSQFAYDVAGDLRHRMEGVRFLDLLHNDSELGFIRHAAKHDATFDAHIVVSERIRNTLVEHYGVQRDRIHVIPNGIDVHGVFDPAGVENREPQGDFVVGYIGRLSDEKDPLLFVHVARELALGKESYRFVMAGDGPLADKVRTRIASYGLADRVDLLGHVEDVPAVLARMDLCVLTSKVEGCPMVALEALAMGRPVVATAVGNLTELLQPPRGRAVAGRDPATLAEAVRSELETSRDPARRKAIRKGIVEQHGLEGMARAYAALFRQEVPSSGHATPTAITAASR